MAFRIHSVDEIAGTPERDNIQRRNELPAALARAKEMVRERLKDGYVHADYLDHWTILKRGNDVWRVRIESLATPTYGAPAAPGSRPLLWNPRAMVTKN